MLKDQPSYRLKTESIKAAPEQSVCADKTERTAARASFKTGHGDKISSLVKVLVKVAGWFGFIVPVSRN